MALLLVFFFQVCSVCHMHCISPAVILGFIFCFIVQFHSYKNIGIDGGITNFYSSMFLGFGGLIVALLMPNNFETLIQNGSHTFEDKVM